MEHTEVTEIVVHARPGSVIGECFRECIEIAASEWRNVLLIHNGKKYEIKPNDLVASIKQRR